MPSDVEIEGPDGNVYQFPDGTDKAAAIRYFKAKGIGVSRSAASPIPPPTIPKPTVPMEEVSRITGGTRAEEHEAAMRPLRDMGEFAEQAIKSTAQISAPGIATTLLRERAPGLVSKLPVPHAKDIERAALPPEELVKQIEMVGSLPAAEGLAGGAEGEVAAAARPRGKTVPKVPSAEMTPEQVAAVDKANRGYQAAKAQIEKRQGLEQASKNMVQKTFDNLHQVHDAARGELDQRWGTFREAMEGAELDPAQAFNSIEAAKGKYLRGSPASLTAFNNLAKELGIQEFADEPGGQLKAIPGTGALPFDTARVHYSAIGDKLAQGDLPGNVYQALKAVQESLDKQLTEAAEKRGLGEQYTKLKGDEHQFLSDWKDSKSPLARAYRSLDANFLEQHVMGRGNEYLTKQLERYRRHGAQPHLPLAARRFAEEASAITKRMPEVKELPQPKEGSAKKGGLLRKAVRMAGGVATSGASSAVGFHHPLPTYIAGSEAAADIYDRVTRTRRTVSPPPQE